ncbi:hypothetical protein ACOT81_38870 [Streptomyces sp. WI04-05B]|uniref:hypothetical protein n=1 Tax=Streptomyces TaxID=1883 RepID=UPI00131A3C6C|nr:MULTISPECIES: hypothetical protein [Streptomyces]MDX2547563.1 hypothetical protein [Streptomyces sp. WI04-05B]MDX2589956.1 hypothetical protein [Streptomyces sp. WI04-05A]MDX3499829.1 hypothetical protein [Streptomyces turgidiscabies]
MRPNRDLLSVRTGAALRTALVEGISPALEPSLRGWIRETGSLDPEEARLLLIRFDLVLPDSYRARYQKQLADRNARQAELNTEWEAAKAAHAARGQSEDVLKPFMLHLPVVPLPTHPCVAFLAEGTSATILWDLVDELLRRLCTEPDPAKPAWVVGFTKGHRQTKKITESLGRLLAESLSVYEIAPDRRGLRRRVEATLAAAVSGAAGAAESAGYSAARQHLEKSRGRLFGLHPDPSGAYDEVVRAVEAVACPLFLPNAQTPTLGTVLAHLRQSSTYEFVVPGKHGAPGSVDAVVAMMAAVWEGHSDRHAGGPGNVPVSREAAEAALTCASALVTLLSRGAVYRP